MIIVLVIVLMDYVIYMKAAIFHLCLIFTFIFTCFYIIITKYHKLHHQFRNTLYIHLSPFIYFKSLPHPPFNPCNVEHKHPVRISYAVLAHTNDAFRQPPSFSKTRRKPGERGKQKRGREPEGWKGRMDAFRFDRTFPPAPLCLCKTK